MKGDLRLAIVMTLLPVSIVFAQKLQIETHKDPKADFAGIRTYSWLPPAPAVRNSAPGSVTNPTLTQEALGPSIVAAVDRQLAARGLAKVDDAAADAHITYFAALTVGFDQTYVGEYYGYVTGWASPIAPGFAPTTSMTVYEKGTVLVDLVSRDGKRAIWRGTARTRVHQELSLEQRIKRINEATERMFEKFPIRPVKK